MFCEITKGIVGPAHKGWVELLRPKGVGGWIQEVNLEDCSLQVLILSLLWIDPIVVGTSVCHFSYRKDRNIRGIPSCFMRRGNSQMVSVVSDVHCGCYLL